MPSSHSTRRENARRSLSPRFSLRCKTIARSLIFAPRRRLPPLFQGNFRSKPAAMPRVSCTYAFLSLYASRKCRTFTLSSFFAPLQNYHSFTHFCSAEAAPAAAAFRKAIFAQNPRYHRGFFAFMPSSHSARRENARRSFAPRSCGTIAHYTPRKILRILRGDPG